MGLTAIGASSVFGILYPGVPDGRRFGFLMFRTFVAAGFALLANDQFEGALGILRPLAPGHPDSIDVRFLVGLAAIGASSQAESEEKKTPFWMRPSLHCGQF